MVKHAFSLRDGIDATYPKSHFTENNEIIQIYGVYRYKLNHLRTDFGHQIKPGPDKKLLLTARITQVEDSRSRWLFRKI